MLVVLVLVGLALTADGAIMNKRGLQTMDPMSLKSFAELFRQTLLDKVAVEMNATVDMSHVLKGKMDSCRVQINSSTDACKSCARSTCQKDPSFTDYLNLANPYTYLEGPLNDMAGKFSDVADLLGDKATGFFTSMKGLAGSASGSVSSGFNGALDAINKGLGALGDGFSSLGSGAVDTANQIGSGLTDVGNQIGGGIKDTGHAIEHAGSSIGHALGSIFGRRRRAIDPETRACMEKCAACKPLLLPSQNQIVTAVCGGEIVRMNNTIQSRVHKIKGVYDATVDKAHPVITKLEFDPTSMNGHMELTNVYVTVRLNGHDMRYKTGVPYAMMNLPLTARNVALEYYGKFR